MSLCLFAIRSGSIDESSRYRLTAVLREAGKAESPTLPLFALDASQVPKNISHREEMREIVPVRTGTSTKPRIVADEETLDSTPEPIVEPKIEPDYGFADDVKGVISLSLLINTEGKVVFDLIVHNDLDEATTRYLLQQFRTLRFSPPTSRGIPVYAWLSYVVTIQAKELP